MTSLAQSATVAVTAERRFHAPPERIFDAWLQPDLVGRFFFGHPRGTMIRAELDARPGGQYRFVDRRVGGEVEHAGRFERVDRPAHLAFTFSAPALWPGETRVSIHVAPDAGGSRLSLTHEGVHPGYAPASQGAWSFVLDRLATEVGG